MKINSQRQMGASLKMGGVFDVAVCVIVLILIIEEYIYHYQIGWLGSVSVRYTLLYTPESVGLILIAAINEGVVVHRMTNQYFIKIGNLSGYLFLLHGIVIGWVRRIYRYFMQIEINRWLLATIALFFSILFAKIYMEGMKMITAMWNKRKR